MTDWKNHQQFQFNLLNNLNVRFSSKFDSGNLENAHLKIQSPFPQFDLLPGYDIINTQLSLKPSSKTFFHFKINVNQQVKLKLYIRRIKILKQIFQSSNNKSSKQFFYQACYKNPSSKQYIRMGKQQCWLQWDEITDEPVCVIQKYFRLKQETYIAFSFPYSYTRMIQLSRKLAIRYKFDQQIYLNKEVLIYSLQGRMVPIFTITNHQGKSSIREDCISTAMFPQLSFIERPFKSNKPVIIISSRVHPGESPSSYATQGLLEFLLDKKDYRSYILRKYFTILVVPMLNPDGVYKGMYRMDSLGQNLNRFYSTPQSHKQPSIYALRNIFQYYANEKKLVMFFDIHAHASLKKGFFTYGNALNQFLHQVESQTFAKILSLNCKNFFYGICNYSQNQMTSKDSNELMTKQGCARVVSHKIGNLIYSYTLQLGFHCSSQKKSHQIQQKLKKQKYITKYGEKYYVQYSSRNHTQYFQKQDFYELGSSLLISILDLLNINPYSNLHEGRMEKIRAGIGHQIYQKEERFKLIETNLLKKIKNIHQLIVSAVIQTIFQRFFVGSSDSFLKQLLGIDMNQSNQKQYNIDLIKQKKVEPTDSQQKIAYNSTPVTKENIFNRNRFSIKNNYGCKSNQEPSSPIPISIILRTYQKDQIINKNIQRKQKILRKSKRDQLNQYKYRYSQKQSNQVSLSTNQYNQKQQLIELISEEELCLLEPSERNKHHKSIIVSLPKGQTNLQKSDRNSLSKGKGQSIRLNKFEFNDPFLSPFSIISNTNKKQLFNMQRYSKLYNGNSQKNNQFSQNSKQIFKVTPNNACILPKIKKQSSQLSKQQIAKNILKTYQRKGTLEINRSKASSVLSKKNSTVETNFGVELKLIRSYEMKYNLMNNTIKGSHNSNIQNQTEQNTNLSQTVEL